MAEQLACDYDTARPSPTAIKTARDAAGNVVGYTAA